MTLRVTIPDLDEFNNAAYFFYKVEKPNEKADDKKQHNNKDFLKLSDTVFVDLSENPLLPDQTFENMAPLFKNYTSDISKINSEFTDKESKPSINLEKWKVAQSLEKQKATPGYYTSRSYKRQRIAPEQKATDYTLPVKPTLSKENLNNMSLKGLSTFEIRLEEAGVQRISNFKTKKSVPKLSIKNIQRTAPKRLMMPVLEPFFPDPNSYKSISLAQLRKTSGANTGTSLTRVVSKPHHLSSSRDSLN